MLQLVRGMQYISAKRLYTHLGLLKEHHTNTVFNPLGAIWITFMMDGCTLLRYKISVTIHSHYKVWKSQDHFFFI